MLMWGINPLGATDPLGLEPLLPRLRTIQEVSSGWEF